MTSSLLARYLPVIAICILGSLPAHGASRSLIRGDVIKTADAYLTFRWKAPASAAFHGKDPDGIHIDTPDAAFSRPGTRPGWWLPGQVNLGMPYKWGGFCTPEEFNEGIRRGLYAGDIYTAEKRRLGDSAVSRHVVGIDCSGFVSRCWKLDRPWSTRELPALCDPLRSYDELRAGDILNSPDNHVLLFKQFLDDTRQRILAYEAGSPPTWKVLLNNIPISMLREQGYQPFRYRKIRD